MAESAARMGDGWGGVALDIGSSSDDNSAADGTGWADVSLQQRSPSPAASGWGGLFAASSEEAHSPAPPSPHLHEPAPAPGLQAEVPPPAVFSPPGSPSPETPPSPEAPAPDPPKLLRQRVLEAIGRVKSAWSSLVGCPLVVAESPVQPPPLALEDGPSSQPDAPDPLASLDIVAAPAQPRAFQEGSAPESPWQHQVVHTVGLISGAVASCHDPIGEHLKEQCVDKFCRHHLFEKQRQIGVMAESELFGVHRKQAHEIVQAAACAYAVCSRQEAIRRCKSLHSDLLEAGATPLCFSVHVRYDETPMRARMFDPERPDTQGAGAGDSVENYFPTSMQTAPAMCTATHVVKVLQTERTYSLLYLCPDGRPFAVHFSLPCWLQSLSDGKAETYVKALAATGLRMPDELVSSFRRRQRLVCTDGDAAVGRCERAIADMDPNSTTLYTLCELHRAYGAHGVVFKPLSQFVQKLRDISRSLTASDGMRSFRVVLRKVIRDMLDFRPHTSPKQIDLVRNRKLLDAFLPPSCPSFRLRRYIIMMLANGDWQNHSALVHNCPGNHCCPDRDSCERKMCMFLVASIAGASPPTWPYARWLGAEKAVGWVGLVQSIHGLLGRAFCEWAGFVPGGASAERPGNDGFLMLLDAGGAAGEWAVGGGGGQGGAADAADAAEENPDRDPAEADTENHRRDLAKYKASAGSWLAARQHDCLGMFLSVALVLQPLTSWMAHLLEAAGDDGKIKDLLAGLARDAEGIRDSPRPLHHGALAHQNIIEQACLADVVALLRDPSRWESMPLQCRTAAFQARICCMLSSIGCQVNESMIAHSGYPWKMFGLLYTADIEQAILADCPKMRDTWSEQIIATYGGGGAGGLRSAACLAELAHTERRIRRETAQIEAKHASIRRSLVGLSVQTHSLLFPLCSAFRTTQEARLSARRARPKCCVRYCRPAPTDGQVGPFDPKPVRKTCGNKKTRGKAGAWRAFVAEQTFGKRGRPDFTSLSAQKNNLPAEEKARLERKSQAALARRRAGATTSFGGSMKAARARENKRRAEELAEDLRSNRRARIDEATLCADVSAVASGSQAIAPHLSSAGRFQDLKQALRLDSMAATARQKNNEAALQHFFDHEGGTMVTSCQAVCPSLASLRADLIPEPPSAFSPSMVVMELAFVATQRQICDALSIPGSGGREALRLSLVQQWQRWHETIDFSPFPSELPSKVRGEHEVCKLAGRCLCTPRGRLERKFVASFHRLLKATCKRKSPHREALVNAQIVALCVGQGRGDFDENDERWQEAELMPGAPISCTRWLHVGHQVLSPCRCSFQGMSGPAASQDNFGIGDAELCADAAFLSQWQVAGQMDLTNTRWVGVLYCVRFSQRPIGPFCPSRLIISPIEGSAALLWCPWGLVRRRNRHAGPDAGWGEIADSFFDNGEDSSAEGSDASSGGGDLALDLDLGVGEAEPLEGVGELGVEDGGAVAAAESGPVSAEEALGAAGDDEGAVVALIDNLAGAPDFGGASDLDQEAAPPPAVVPLAAAAAPLPPPPPAAVALQLERDRVALPIAAGTLTWYKYSGDFVAVCRHHGSGCRKHRTSNANDRRQAQGRPLGYLFAWAEAFEEHGDGASHRAAVPTFGDRAAARARLANIEGSAALFAKERPRREDEGPEPEANP